ncbi:hypothetical protein F4775DRAFT_607795 [Biscogniauxia sp. FL1348]|nr:hypothetical protein F4775DRAFT_607795 [Biscogniauxia sp. FL1348]
MTINSGLGNEQVPLAFLPPSGETKEAGEEKKTTRSVPWVPIAICGMACRLPGGIASPQELWDFLIAGGDANSEAPKSRFNLEAYKSSKRKPGTTVTTRGYFLDDSNDLSSIDSSFFSMGRTELERLDPQQRLLLEVTKEALDDAGEINYKNTNIGTYVGNYGNDWYDLFYQEQQRYGRYQLSVNTDFMVSNRVSYELGLMGPSMTIRTGCSASLVGLNEACMALARGDCKSAIVAGTNIILAPNLSITMSETGVISRDASCKSFSANTDGYGRGEAVVSFFIKPLDDAIRDGNPIRAVLAGSAANHDGRTNGLTLPSDIAQEALIRRAYEVGGLTDLSKTAFVECHGTGTKRGDPIETNAIANAFGDKGIHIGSVKANLGHSEGASGMTSLMKAVLALEHRQIPPNIKALPLNPAIRWDRLKVPTEPLEWPEDRLERISINSFGIGGSNAHVIVDSAASYGISSPTAAKKTSPAMPIGIKGNQPQLLVFSANHPQSLKTMIESYQTYLEKNPDSLADVAYTLANRREHLPHRSFVVSTPDLPGSAAAPTAPPKAGQKPNLVMVFTGQGAQWPQMGRELVRTNPIFKETIQALDKHLKATLGENAPSWSIEKELAKPARTSKVNEAEFSQPLCTAIQIALVDTLAAAGIEPTAVVGHSSGEVAAAYAAGALSAREAITVAYCRGAAAKSQTRIGGMAAVGMSWESVEKYLLPGTSVACDNSPNSVTLSGDADVLSDVVAAIKEGEPSVPVTMLKVEKAYHSHHMAEVGGEYYNSLRSAGVTGRPAQKLFFSSVIGKLLEDDAEEDPKLGPKYWQTNFESPVLFKSAVTDLLSHPDIKNPVFLEIGPHAALAGPLRQIMARENKPAPHVPTLARRANGVESFLSALGRLFTLHVEVNFKALMPTGTTMPDLPRYPWNHSKSYWFETRVSKEWRMREHKYHDLLGVRVAESSALEPVWRNLFHLDNAPWVRDHKVNGDIVFPFAGYVGMAAEAIRQTSGIEEGVSIRNMAVSRALVVSSTNPVELVTSLKRSRLNDSQVSEWWEFVISSHNGHAWTKHASGEVRAESGAPDEADESIPKTLPRKVNGKKWYDTVRKGGLEYGEHFTVLNDIMTRTSGQRQAISNIRNNWHGDEENYHLHPVVLDAYLQLLICAARYGLSHDYRQVLPTSISSLTMFRTTEDSIDVNTSANVDEDGVTGKGSCIAGNKIVLKLSGVRMSREDSNAENDKGVNITARTEWGRHIDFEEFTRLVKPSSHNAEHISALNELAELAIAVGKRSLKTDAALSPHMQKYAAWLSGQTVQSSLESLESVELLKKIECIAQQLAQTPAAPAAAAIASIATNAASILSGQNAMEILNSGNTLSKLQAFLRDHDASGLLRTLAHTKPNLRVLELGAGAGAATAEYLRSLTRASPDGQVLYSAYVLSDPASGMVNKAREQLKGMPNLQFATLDIGRDPVEQGFAERQGEFDLVIATGVVGATPRLTESLSHVHRLLAPGGRLLLQEPRHGLKWLKLVLGTLPGWWVGSADARADEPYVRPERWGAALRDAGFRGLDAVVPPAADSDCESHVSSVMLAQAGGAISRGKSIALLVAHKSAADQSPVARELARRGYELTVCELSDAPPAGQDVVSLLDTATAGPFLDAVDADGFAQLKAFVSGLSPAAGLLWVTGLSQVGVRDPRYAQVVGLARTFRSELEVQFATCEVDDFGRGAAAVADVFEHFHGRADDGPLDPDYEYAIVGGATLVPRFFPAALDAELVAGEEMKEAVVEMGKPGRLDTLQWAGAQAVGEPLAEEEVEIEVHALGLDYRSVLMATGTMKGFAIGREGAGVVRNVGSGVSKFCPGDRVVFLKPGSFATAVRAPQALCEKIPEGVDFVDAATLPLAFATAHYSLIEVGHLKKGESVLIHSGAGAVGLAAIQIAQLVGAEVYTTAGSAEKRAFLASEFGIPAERIGDSRSAAFAGLVARQTGGRGVDLALNPLSGELLHATWRCIAEYGTMVQLGKRDATGKGKLDMEGFQANRTYCSVDMDQMAVDRPEKIEALLSRTMQLLRSGSIAPLPVSKVFSASELHQAVKSMQPGTHTGKTVLSVRSLTPNNNNQPQLGAIAVSRPQPLRLNPTASYLLVGGLGGLGRSFAVWLAQRGARHLTILSRSAGLGAHDADFVREVSSMGCAVQLVRGDVTELSDVRGAVAAANAAAPLRGVVNMSMVLRDEALGRMSYAQWAACVAPKVRGTWALHEATAELSSTLDFFLLFGSLSGATGQPGQANYAAANTFLDAFVQFRAGRGLPCSAVDIGAVEGAGYLSENEALLRKMQGTGWRALSERELFWGLERAILRALRQKNDATTMTAVLAALESGRNFVDPHNFLLGIAPVVPLSSPDASARHRRDRRMAVYHNASGAEASSSSSSSDGGLAALIAAGKENPALFKGAGAATLIARETGKKIFSLLLKADEEPDITVGLSELGMDSLIAIDMRTWWRQTLGFDISVLEMLAMGTLEALGKKGADGLLALYED